MFGFLNVYKPKGMTSHDVVAKLRKITKIKQIGHTGTLDPFAEGVLPICMGKATRLIEYLQDDKEYVATVQFGKTTDTYDLEGSVTEEFNKKVSKSEVLEKLKEFEGEIQQIPPIYSAIKLNGKKLYDYARAGQTVEIEPRVVFISKIELLSFDEENQQAEILVACSKGTYIRSIAYDLGKKLNTGGYLVKLIRTKAGKFGIKAAVALSELDSTEKVLEDLINPIDILDLPKLYISDFEHEKVLQGQFLKNNTEFCNVFVLLIYNGSVDAVAFVEKDKIKVKKVFV